MLCYLNDMPSSMKELKNNVKIYWLGFPMLKTICKFCCITPHSLRFPIFNGQYWQQWLSRWCDSQPVPTLMWQLLKEPPWTNYPATGKSLLEIHACCANKILETRKTAYYHMLIFQASRHATGVSSQPGTPYIYLALLLQHSTKYEFLHGKVVL